MQKRANRRVAVVGFFLVGFAVAAEAAPQEVFRATSFEAAKEAALAEGKYLLVNASADWCAPCRRMDAETWVDEAVIEWLTEHTVAIKIDTDEQDELADLLGVSAIPTMIVWSEGEEFDRVSGFKSPETLLAWLDGITRGERDIDRLRAAAGDRMDAEGNVDVEARLRLARELGRRGDFDEATDEFVWLWDNMLRFDPSMYGVRLSFMVADMQHLATTHEPAREAFKALRDRYDPLPTSDSRDMLDWARLNVVIGDQAATLVWFDRFKEELAGAGAVKSLELDLFPLLAARERWDDIASVFPKSKG